VNPYFLNSELLPAARGGDALIVHPHTQRTGGNTIRRKVLEAVYGRSRVYNDFNVRDARKWPDLTDADLEGCRAFTGHFDFRDNGLKRPVFPVAVLRHPVYRAVSLYHFIKKKDTHRHHALALQCGMEEFYRRASAETPGYFRELQCRRICSHPDARVALELVNTRYLGVAFTEHLDQFVAALGAALEWPPVPVDSMPPDAERYDSEVTPSFRALVLEQNAEDLALYEAIANGSAPFALTGAPPRASFLQRTKNALRPTMRKRRGIK
jgi:hypothetical protein